jgi:hypothetical protein
LAFLGMFSVSNFGAPSCVQESGVSAFYLTLHSIVLSSVMCL